MSVVGLPILASAPFCASATPVVPEIPYTVTRLSQSAIVIDCLNVNVAAIATDSGIVVIDSNRSAGVMRRLRAVIEKEFRRQDFAYLINTHGDPDHASGNPAFSSVPLIAHRDYAAYVAHAKAARLRNAWNLQSRLEEARARYASMVRDSPEAGALLSRIAELELLNTAPQDGREARSPEITFSDSLKLELGSVTIELYFCGEAHTNHDIVVYVPEGKLLLTGDLICSPRSPCFAIDALADIPRLVGGLGALLQRRTGLETVVPGHGRILSRSDLAGFCRILAEQYGNVRIENSAAWVLSQAIEREGIEAALERYPPPPAANPGTLEWSEGELGRLGERLMRRGMTPEAVSVLTLAVRVLPESSFLYSCLGDACMQNDDLEGAVVAYMRSLTQNPDNRHAADMLKILK